MSSALQSDSLAGPYRSLLRNTHEGILGVEFLAPEANPPDAPDQLALPPKEAEWQEPRLGRAAACSGHGCRDCEERIRPALDCLVASMAAAGEKRHSDLKLLELANKLDLDFRDDARLDKAVSAVARRLGVELAWFADPRCQVNVAERGNDQGTGSRRAQGNLAHARAHHAADGQAAQAADAARRVQAAAHAAVRGPGTPQRLAGAGESACCTRLRRLAPAGCD